jgi:hypothetical protein
MLQVGKCCGLAVDIVDLWRIVIAQVIRLSELEALFVWLSLPASGGMTRALRLTPFHRDIWLGCRLQDRSSRRPAG